MQQMNEPKWYETLTMIAVLAIAPFVVTGLTLALGTWMR